MSDPFLAEIRIFGFGFPPRGWAACNGQLLSISQNTALFSLLGTTYGGDGKTTFALPNLMGRAAMHPGQGNGLSLRELGEEGGSETVTLIESQIPTHAHQLLAVVTEAAARDPKGKLPARPQRAKRLYGEKANATMAAAALKRAGGSRPHNNMQPYLTVNFCIALQGIYPPRS